MPKLSLRARCLARSVYPVCLETSHFVIARTRGETSTKRSAVLTFTSSLREKSPRRPGIPTGVRHIKDEQTSRGRDWHFAIDHVHMLRLRFKYNRVCNSLRRILRSHRLPPAVLVLTLTCLHEEHLWACCLGAAIELIYWHLVSKSL
ncbi:hypothetical protein ElyMa_001675400 [Elysia marginata]|uniref:Uncharacterized protein n=1 Tax=Elysia marginata TaxID=1093978 RepID=A0AAV4JUA6_9GAST|nr:hypothetical protein ElyMa_001675400 [Elysia marginata]